MSEEQEIVLRKGAVGTSGDSNAPSTLDIEKRSVGIVISTENPVVEWDRRNSRYMPTVIRAAGVEHPNQVPLLDTHSREGVQDVIGSVRNIRVEDGKLVGDAVYSTTPAGEAAFTLVREGHLTDYSIGCLPKTVEYDGRDASMRKIITSSSLMEVSNCPVGADASAKMRAAVVEPQEPPAQPQQDPTERSMTQEEMKAQEATVRAAAVAEQKEIAALCRAHDLDPVEMIGRSLVEVKDEALKRHAEKNKPAAPAAAPASTTIIRGEDHADKISRAAELAITLRSGLELSKEDESIARDFAGFSIPEMAREVLRSRSKTYSGSKEDVIKRAISTSDFANIFLNVANKSVKMGWGLADTHWRKFCQVGSVSDFKSITMTRATALTQGFRQVKEGGEYKLDSRSDEKETFSIDKYGDRIAYTYEAMVNDDLGQLKDAAEQFGIMSQVLIDELVFAVLTANAAMGDGTALFHANHGNLLTAGGTVSEAGFDAARIAMRKQKEGRAYTNISPKFLIAPLELQLSADKLLNSSTFADGVTAATSNVNTVANMIAAPNRIYTPYLTGAPWYMLSDRNTVKVFFMDGKQTPTLESDVGYTVDGLDFKARFEVGAKATDWRGMLKSNGVA